MPRIATLDVGGTSFEVAGFEGTLALSHAFELSADAFVVGDPPATADLLGETFKLTITDPHGGAMTVHGVVLAVERHAGTLAKAAGLALTLGSPVAPLAIGRDSRVFAEMSVVDVVKDVLARGGVADVEWRVGSYPTRHYVTQHRESDWAFVERLLAEEGIHYFFEHDDAASKLILTDDSTVSDAIDGDAELPFHEGTGLEAAAAAIYEVQKRAGVVHDAVRLRDYSFEKPRLELDAKAGDGKHELYDFPGRFAVPDDGKRLAQRRLEALQARRVVVSGKTSTTRVRAGRTFTISGHPVEALNADYLVERVTYRSSELRGAADADGAAGLGIVWVAVPKTTPHRPRRSRPVTRDPGGPQSGVVVGAAGQEIFPDKDGRVRVQFYWDRIGKRDDKASTWLRVGQFALGGSMVLPRVGWDVLVHHGEGDIDAPFVSGHLYDGQFPVPYKLPDNKTRTAWQTATTPGGGSSNEVRFEDKKGGEELFMNASSDMNVVVGDNKSEKVGVDSTEQIGANLSVKVGSNFKVGVKSNQSVSVGGSETLTVSASRSVAVGGSETTTIGGSRSVTVTSGSTVDAKGGRSVTVGGSMTSLAALGVNRMVLGSLDVTVGGTWLSAAATGLANMTGGAGAETVGAAKIYAGAAGCTTSVKGVAAETVGGAYVIATGGNAGESATGRLAFTVGGAFLANAPKIEVEADSEISIRVGGASLSITSSCVEIRAPMIGAPGATISKKASKIVHN